MKTCPNVELIGALAENRLKKHARKALLQHLQNCTICNNLFTKTKTYLECNTPLPNSEPKEINHFQQLIMQKVLTFTFYWEKANLNSVIAPILNVAESKTSFDLLFSSPYLDLPSFSLMKYGDKFMIQSEILPCKVEFNGKEIMQVKLNKNQLSFTLESSHIPSIKFYSSQFEKGVLTLTFFYE